MKKIITLILLIAASIMMVLSNGHYMIAFAAWAFPLLFMIATKDMKPLTTLIVISTLSFISFFIGFMYFGSRSMANFTFYIPAIMGILYALPFYLQKLSYKHSNKFITTLIFPSTLALIDYTVLYFSPNGSWGVLGYSQHGFLPMAQMASVIGVAGITFIITWIVSTIYWMLYVESSNKKKYAMGMAVFVFLILLFGSLRVSKDYKGETVMVSGIHVFDLRSDETRELYSLLETDKEAFMEESDKLVDKLIEQTIIEAKLGSRIIVHSECSPDVYYTQMDDYMERIKNVANEYDVYVVTNPFINYVGKQKDENVLYIINPDGKIALTHYKFGGNLFEGTVCGDKEIRYVDTEYGRISGIICWDKDFPAIINQVGEKSIDILLTPSADWKQISPTHSINGNFRGIENGVNVVSQTINGMSMITNYKGEVLDSMNHFTTNDWVMRGHVPTEGINTIYNVCGKYFVYCVILLFIIATFFTFVKKES